MTKKIREINKSVYNTYKHAIGSAYYCFTPKVKDRIFHKSRCFFIFEGGGEVNNIFFHSVKNKIDFSDVLFIFECVKKLKDEGIEFVAVTSGVLKKYEWIKKQVLKLGGGVQEDCEGYIFRTDAIERLIEWFNLWRRRKRMTD